LLLVAGKILFDPLPGEPAPLRRGVRGGFDGTGHRVQIIKEQATSNQHLDFNGFWFFIPDTFMTSGARKRVPDFFKCYCFVNS